MKTLADYGIDEVKFNYEQIQEIKEGIVSDVDISTYADPKFDHFQMIQIRLGLENGVDISTYANPKFHSEKMERIRLKLEKDAANSTDSKSTSTKFMNFFRR